MPTYELNFIWVGPKKMPQGQLDNLDRISAYSHDLVINIWAIPELLHPDLRSHFELKQYSIRNIDTLLDANVAPTTYEIVQLLKISTIYSGLADILKFLILARPVKDNETSKRFYMEADNRYPADLDEFIDNRKFICHLAADGEIRVDSFYVDVDSFVGSTFKKGSRTHTELFLGDSTINRCIKELIKIDRSKGLSQGDILNSFGKVNGTLLVRIMHANNSFKIGKHSYGDNNFSRFGIYDGRSWLGSNINETITNVHTHAMYFRCDELKHELSDTYEKLLNSNGPFCLLRKEIPRLHDIFSGNMLSAHDAYKLQNKTTWVNEVTDSKSKWKRLQSWPQQKPTEQYNTPNKTLPVASKSKMTREDTTDTRGDHTFAGLRRGFLLS